jgi:hypothetical protein
MEKLVDILMSSTFNKNMYEYNWSYSKLVIRKIENRQTIIDKEIHNAYILIDIMCTYLGLIKIEHADLVNYSRGDKKYYDILKGYIIEIIKNANTKSYKYLLDDYGVSIWTDDEKTYIFFESYWEGFITGFFKVFNISRY